MPRKNIRLIRDLFETMAKKNPEQIALHFEGRDVSYAELDSLSNRLAQGLFKMGLHKGDKVAGFILNSIEFAVTYFAAMKAGLIFIPLNTRLIGPNLEYILNHSECDILIYHVEFEEVIAQIRPSLKFTKRFLKIGRKSSDYDPCFDEVVASANSTGLQVPLSGDDEALYLYTAGTTGNPKGVIHIHSSCSIVGRHWAEAFKMKEGGRLLIVLPLFHVFGIHCCLLPAIISGTKVILTKGFHVEETLELIQIHKVTILHLVPSMGFLLINHANLGRYDLSSIREMMLGGSLGPPGLFEAWRQRFPHIRIINAYGQTESCPCATGYWDRDILEKPGSVGKPWNNVLLKIIDERGKELTFGQVGEVTYKVSSLMKGYYKEPELTAQTIRDGWLYSGDLGYLDKEGYLYIVDRKKDIIIRGGENISSMEVEEVLHRHNAVLEAAAIGHPDRLLGETVMAVVVKKDGFDLTEEALKDHCRKNLAGFKVPTKVAFIDQLPRNPGGKVLKRVLKERFVKNHG
jgi:long-chain acyl-CoA synthetase